MRVRCHGKVARIEVAAADMEKVFARRAEIAAAVKAAALYRLHLIWKDSAAAA